MEFVTIKKEDESKSHYSLPFKYALYIIPNGEILNESKHIKYEGYIKGDKITNIDIPENDILNDSMIKWLKEHGFDSFFNSSKFTIPYNDKNFRTYLHNVTIEHKTLQEIKEKINEYTGSNFSKAIFIGQSIKSDLLGYFEGHPIYNKYFDNGLFLPTELQNMTILDFVDNSGYVKGDNHYGPLKLTELWQEFVKSHLLSFTEKDATKKAHESPLVDCALSVEIIIKSYLKKDNNIFLFQSNDESKFVKKMNCLFLKNGQKKCRLNNEMADCSFNKDNSKKYKYFECYKGSHPDGNFYRSLRFCKETKEERTDNTTYCNNKIYFEKNSEYKFIPLKQSTPTPTPIPEPTPTPTPNQPNQPNQPTYT